MVPEVYHHGGIRLNPLTVAKQLHRNILANTHPFTSQLRTPSAHPITRLRKCVNPDISPWARMPSRPVPRVLVLGGIRTTLMTQKSLDELRLEFCQVAEQRG